LQDINVWDDETPLDVDEVSVPFLREVELAAGSGRFVIEESSNASLRFGKRSLRNNGVQFDHAKCVTVRGNSMLPVLRDGATVGVNVGKSAIGDIVDGDLYAINHNGQLRVKQVYRLPSGIRLRSFNRDEHPDEDYTFQQIQEEQIAILGHVFWWGMFAR
jgi:phage repressor protein C with HTH and peptisase S24 domain